MYAYGKHLGLAFQVVDDILDFTQSAEQLGKPQGQDLASGNLTAPAIFALRNSTELVRLDSGSRRGGAGLALRRHCQRQRMPSPCRAVPTHDVLAFILTPCSQEELIQSEFAEPDSLKRAIDIVVSAGGVETARQLARDEADKALAAIKVLPPSPAKRSLELMVDYVLDRIY